MSDATASLSVSGSAKGSLAALALASALLILPGRMDYPELHTILDTGMCLLSGVLALLLWDVGSRSSQTVLKGLAVSFAATWALELVHVMVTIEWSGALAPIAHSRNLLRPATWPPAAYVLPIGFLAALGPLHRRPVSLTALTVGLFAISLGLLAAFFWLPRYASPTWLGITRPLLIAVPLLWAAVAWLGWRRRAGDRVLPALALMAAVIVIAHTSMLYSRAPHDTPAMVAHLGKVGGYLILLLSLMKMAAHDMRERIHAERTLAEASTHTRTRAIFDTALDSVITMDHEGRITEFNRAAEETFGYRQSEVLGRPLDEMIIPPAFREQHRRGLARHLATGESTILGKRIELAGWRADGRTVDLELSVNRIPGEGPAMFAGFARDITARKQAEADLQESQARFQTLTESLPHLVWTCRADGWCDYLSRQWVEYTGRSESEQLGYGWLNHLHPEDRERTQAEWTAAVARGDRFEIEFRIRRADGVYRWFRTRAVPLRDADGRTVKWFGSNTDFDDRKHAERRLAAQLERFSLLDRITRAIGERQDLRSIFQVVIRSLEDHLPIDFGCICLHEAPQTSMTVTCVGVRSRPLALQLAISEQARVDLDENGLARCVRGELVYEADITRSNFPFPRRLASGGLRSLVISPLLVESSVFGVLVAARTEVDGFTSADCEFLRQLSEHVALAAHQARIHTALQQAYDDLHETQRTVMQQERLRALGQMASGIAHDINNALSPVALYTDSLLEREPGLSETGRGHLITIQRAIDDVAETVSRMREFYRPREPQMHLTRVDLNPLVQQAVDLTRARWSDEPQRRGAVIDMRTELAADLPPLAGVESEIRDALTNLIFNAVDAMPEGGRLLLRTRALTRNGGLDERLATVEVTDSGTGMDEETRRRCLEPFFTTKGERGSGLGLAMVYGMIQRHRGDLELESEPGEGTTVRLVFPATAAPVASTSAVRHDTPQRPTRRLRILLIDDDPLVIESLREVLQGDGHSVTTADGGQAGIDAFVAAEKGGEPFDLVITDLGMPYVDGRTVAIGIRAASPSTPVILLTGWGQRMIAANDIPPEVSRVLSKPPKLHEMRAAIAELSEAARTTH
jgi:PAS domain S-box-containing protein